MRCLVTGGCGFIGSHLSEKLLKSGWEVCIIDDLTTGSFDNIHHLVDDDKFSCVLDDVTNKHLIAELIDSADVIFHLAAVVGVRLVVEEQIRTISTNIKLTEIVLEMCAKKKKPVLVTSTSEVYGKLNKDVFNEEDDLVLGSTSKSRWCYASSKIIDEFLAKAYFKEKKLPTVIVRLFNTIGPGQTGQYGMVVPRFIKQSLSDKPIEVYGNGQQRRCFCYVGDVVDAMISLIQDDGALEGEVFNIGSTEDISILELAEKVKKLTNSNSEIKFVPYEQVYEKGFEDMIYRKPDISKIHRQIGYCPTKTLDEILIEIIESERKKK